MTYTPIAKGTTNWDVPLNAALAQLDANITSSSSTALQAANNLSDLTDVNTARANLQLTGLANAKSNLTATTNPSAGSDNTQGYSIGSTWVNTTTNAIFIASNVSTGAAVWLQIPVTFVDRTTSQSIAGTKTFTSTINGSQSGDATAYNASYSALNPNNAAFSYSAFGPTGRFLGAAVTGDTVGRFVALVDGTLSWGSGAATRDTNLYRGGANLLQTDDAFQAANFPSGAWTPWTPTWTTSSGSNTPSYGNAVVDCSYTKFGRTVFFRFDITFGTTTNFGAAPTTGDNWQFSLPIAPVTAAGNTLAMFDGHQSNAGATILRARVTPAGTGIMLSVESGRPDAVAVTNNGDVDSLTPFTWASGNALHGVGFYETAS